MKIEVNLQKKYFFAILSAAVILAAVFGVYAYGTSNPAVFGHTAEELAITLPNGSTSTLQQAITNNYIGGGGSSVSNTYNINGSGSFLVKKVTFGYYSICLLSVDGRVACAGHYGYGQLGIGWGVISGYNVYLFQLLELSGVEELYGDGLNQCALMSDSSLKCWGYNGHGQAGVGTNTESGAEFSSPVAYPTTVIGSGLINVSFSPDVSAGHVCALKTDGTVWCWGYNGYGQLGEGDTTSRATPTLVSALGGVKYIEAAGSGSYGYTCALKTNGEVWCWGINVYGQLGDGTATQRTSPVKANIDNVDSIATSRSDGYYGTNCAIKTDGTVWCWGYNGYGQLGDDSVTVRYNPVQARNIGSNLPNAKKILISGTPSAVTVCALLIDNSLACWGYNNYGQVGDGTIADKHVPTIVLPPNSVKDFIIAGGTSAATTCALKTDGTVWCWGYNGYVQIPSEGPLSYSSKLIPTKIRGISNVESIYTRVGGPSGTTENFCAILNDKSVRCWGYNGYGQLGLGYTSTYSPTPAKPIINF